MLQQEESVKTIKEILTEAAALGRKVGVAKGEFITASGSMCINGLVGAVINGAPMRSLSDYSVMVVSSEFRDVVEVLAPFIGLPARWQELANWNNNVASSEAVIGALEEAAASLP
jgi:hypothetical protein